MICLRRGRWRRRGLARLAETASQAKAKASRKACRRSTAARRSANSTLTSSRQYAKSAPRRRSSDPAVEIQHLVAERMAADPGQNVEVVTRQVLAGDPQLARCYSEAKPLPMTTPPSATETMVEQALVKAQRVQRELAQMVAGASRHYNALSEAEKDALPLRRERRLRPGDNLRPGETRIAKLSPPDLGGGTFAVTGA